VRVCLDTNVLVSAFASRGLCADLLELVLLEHDLVVGRNVLNELRKALRDKIKHPAARSSEIVEFVAGEAVGVIEAAEAVVASVDADDARVLGEARAGQVQFFVTGDAALVKIGAVAGLAIVSPRQFWEALQANLKSARP
jgi:putative PIN family toxin of toxin-antitoxin system